jgi:hypothetical protein
MPCIILFLVSYVGVARPAYVGRVFPLGAFAPVPGGGCGDGLR